MGLAFIMIIIIFIIILMVGFPAACMGAALIVFGIIGVVKTEKIQFLKNKTLPTIAIIVGVITAAVGVAVTVFDFVVFGGMIKAFIK